LPFIRIQNPQVMTKKMDTVKINTIWGGRAEACGALAPSGAGSLKVWGVGMPNSGAGEKVEDRIYGETDKGKAERLMSTPFLTHFVAGLVDQMLLTQTLEIRRGSREEVVGFVARKLAGEGLKSLVSTLTRAFEECADVLEFYPEDAELKDMITDLRHR